MGKVLVYFIFGSLIGVLLPFVFLFAALILRQHHIEVFLLTSSKLR